MNATNANTQNSFEHPRAWNKVWFDWDHPMWRRELRLLVSFLTTGRQNCCRTVELGTGHRPRGFVGERDTTSSGTHLSTNAGRGRMCAAQRAFRTNRTGLNRDTKP